MKIFTLIFLLFASSRCFAAGIPEPSPTREGPSVGTGTLYLVLSHDPDFLELLKKFSVPAYNRGRAMIVRLNAAPASLPAEVRRKLRPVTMDEVHNEPAGSRMKSEADPKIRAVLSKVSAAQLKSGTELLTYVGKRNTAQLDVMSGSGNKVAMDAVAEAFKGYGLTVERNCYRDRKFDKECNIIGRRDGLAPDSRVILLIGHLDSVGYDNAGADDNASGAAGLIEMARVLAGYGSDHAFIFAASNGEENEVAGGYALKEELKRTGLLGRIDYVINMDMIAWNKDGVVDVETNKEFLAYAEWVSDMALTYTRLQPHIATPAWGSDHVPFLEAGIPTYLSIEHWDAKNPCYHKACDKPDILSWDYASEIVKLNLAVIAGKARLTPVRS